MRGPGPSQGDDIPAKPRMGRAFRSHPHGHSHTLTPQTRRMRRGRTAPSHRPPPPPAHGLPPLPCPVPVRPFNAGLLPHPHAESHASTPSHLPSHPLSQADVGGGGGAGEAPVVPTVGGTPPLGDGPGGGCRAAGRCIAPASSRGRLRASFLVAERHRWSCRPLTAKSPPALWRRSPLVRTPEFPRG